VWHLLTGWLQKKEDMNETLLKKVVLLVCNEFQLYENGDLLF